MPEVRSHFMDRKQTDHPKDINKECVARVHPLRTSKIAQSPNRSIKKLRGGEAFSVGPPGPSLFYI